MANLGSKLKKLWDTAEAVWDESFFRAEGEQTRFRKFLHFWVLVWRSFVRNRCPVRASALSYTTLLALIPMLAVAMSVSSMFLKKTGENQIREFIEEFVNRMIPQYNPAVTNIADVAAAPTPSLPELTESRIAETNLSEGGTSNNPALMAPTNSVVGAAMGALSTARTNEPVVGPGEVSTNQPPPIKDERVIAAQRDFAQYIHSFIQNTNSEALGLTGMFFLLITVILTLTRIEETFNDIWGVSRGREWFTRVTNYLAAIVLGPALLGLALGMASGPRFERTRDILAGMPFLELMVSTIIPSVVICFSFTLFYKLMPNTKVHFTAALIGGAFAGILWQVYNLLGFLLASRAVNASTIYGSFALIPLFMGGLYVVWLTVLFGAQVAYAFQNREAYLQEKIVENVNQRGREFVALRLMTCIGQRYQRGMPLATVPEMSRELGIPSRLIQQVLHVLLNARLVVEISRGEPAYAPARPLQDITAHHVLMAMRATLGQELMTRDEPVRAEVFGEFARIQAAEKEAASAVSMLALVNRAQARLELSPPAEHEDIKLTPALAPSQASVEERAQESIETHSINSVPVVERDKPSEPEPEPALPQAKTPEKSRPVVEPNDEDRNFPL
jgi:membrane protein